MAVVSASSAGTIPDRARAARRYPESAESRDAAASHTSTPSGLSFRHVCARCTASCVFPVPPGQSRTCAARAAAPVPAGAVVSASHCPGARLSSEPGPLCGLGVKQSASAGAAPEVTGAPGAPP